MKKALLKLLILPFLLGLSLPVHGGDVTIITSSDADLYQESLEGFRKTLRHRIVSEHDMKGDLDRGRKALTEIQSKINPNLIFTIGTPALQVAARKTTIPPVVYSMVFNPFSIIGAGAKNITGVSMNVSVEQTIRLFKDLSPKIRRVGMVFNQARSGHLVLRAALVARKQGVQLVTRKIRYPREAIKALNSLQGKIDALWILPDETILLPEVVQYMLLFSYENKVPVLGLSEKQTRMGALLSLSYGSSRDMGRQAGEIANSILSGRKPARIPHTTPRQVKLTVNLRAAQKLGVEIPNRVLERADNAVKAPVYKDGDWWVFRVEEGGESEEYRVTYKNGKFESDDLEFLTGSDNLAALVFGPLVSVHLNDPEYRWLDFPLVAGKKWSFRYRQEGNVNLAAMVGGDYSYYDEMGGSENITWHSDAEVIGPVPELVETPAGKFKVIEIRRKDISQEERDLTYFYSPKTKTVVKFEIRENPTSGRHGGRHTRLDLVKYGHEAPAVGAAVVKAPATKMPVREIDWSPVKAPVYRDGDWWVFRVKGEGRPSEEYRVTYKNGKFDSDAPEFLTGSDESYSFVFGPLVSVHLNDPKKRWLDFPLVAGKKWSLIGFLWPEGTVFPRGWSSAEVEIIGPAAQPVETPAGKFKVIEIRQVFERQSLQPYYTRPNELTIDLVYFYSPRTKSVVKLTTHLVSYSEGVASTWGEDEYEMELIEYGHEAPIDWSSVKAPVYKDGDWWVFRVKGEGRPSEEYRVTYKNGKFESDDPEFLTGSDDSASFVFGPLVSVHLNDPKKRWLDFPLVAGKKWSFAGFLWPEDTVFTRMWSSAEPEIIGPAPQPVETPAGKFKVIEIRQVFERQPHFILPWGNPEVGQFTIDLVYFYSPRTKSVVKQATHLVSTLGDEAEYEMELINYGHEAPAVGVPVVKAPK